MGMGLYDTEGPYDGYFFPPDRDPAPRHPRRPPWWRRWLLPPWRRLAKKMKAG